MLNQIEVTFQPIADNPIPTRQQVTATGLHGLLFRTVLPAVSRRAADDLHEQAPPKSYAMAPQYSDAGNLTGLRLGAWQTDTAVCLQDAWQEMMVKQTVLSLGTHSFQVAEAAASEPQSFMDLLLGPPRPQMRLQFLTPTVFRQGPGHLPLPLPGNVFMRPAQVWQQYAPAALCLPKDWEAWCQENVFVSQHQIRTVTTRITPRERLTGFVGWVSFVAQSDNEPYIQLWQALGRLAAYCGVGYKTTMGLGAVASQPRRAAAEQPRPA